MRIANKGLGIGTIAEQNFNVVGVGPPAADVHGATN
jgi:hypothetical protein